MFWRSTAPARRSAGFIELCLLTPAVTVPSGSQWVHEIKHDGYRFICRREGNWIRVFSRRGHDLAGQVPRIMDTSARHPATSVTLDSESVACGTGGVTDLELLGVALGRPAKREVFLYAFDLVELEGRDTRREPWLEPTLEISASPAWWRTRRAAIRSRRRKRRRGHVPSRLPYKLEGVVAKRRDKPALWVGEIAGLDQGQEPRTHRLRPD
jgi:bifunctional non-homologous end joining protein LigD